MIQAINLSCSRDDRTLFSELNFSVNAGQVLLLEGKNGSGKTTLLRILCGFREADSGQILWHNQPIENTDYHADMAYIGHLDGIKKELTVLENLKMSLALATAGNYSITQALEKVHLAGYDDALVQTLSAGQKRRLSLARLLITKKPLWLLDEPFTSLDKGGILLISQLMVEHCQLGGLIILTSHHDLDLKAIEVQRINLSQRNKILL
jgi:heme exporter protein A